MRKAISEIIVVVIILAAAVSLTGIAYVFMSGLQGQATSEVQESGEQSLKKIGSCIKVISFDAKTNSLWVRNCGRYAIGNVTVFVDGNPAFSGAIDAKPDEVKSIIISASAGVHEIKVLGDYASALVSVNMTG